MGSYFVSNETSLVLDSSLTFDDIQKNATQYIVGSLILATVSALFFGLISYLLLMAFSSDKNKTNLN